MGKHRQDWISLVCGCEDQRRRDCSPQMCERLLQRVWPGGWGTVINSLFLHRQPGHGATLQQGVQSTSARLLLSLYNVRSPSELNAKPAGLAVLLDTALRDARPSPLPRDGKPGSALGGQSLSTGPWLALSSWGRSPSRWDGARRPPLAQLPSTGAAEPPFSCPLFPRLPGAC